MKKLIFLLIFCFISVIYFDMGFSETVSVKKGTESTQISDELSDNNKNSTIFNNNLSVQSRLSFSPPAVGQVGSWVTVGSSTTDAEAKQFILNNYIPRFLGEKVSYNGKLGANVGDTLKLTLGASAIINLNYYSFSNPTYVPYVSWYGQIVVANLSAKSSSNAVSVKVANNSSGNYEITLTRNTAEKNENYEISLSYNYTFEYYFASYINPPLGSGWSAWAPANTETISSKNTTIDIPAEALSDNLSAEPVSQSVNVGTEVNSLDLRDFVENVKIGNTTLSNNQYDVGLLDTSLDFNLVGNKTAKVRVTAVNDSSKTVDIDVPVNVLWGNTILAKDASLSKVVASVSMLDNNGSPYFVANKGNGLSTATTTLGSRPQIFLYDKDLNNYKKKISSTVSQTSASFMNVLNTEFEAIKDSLSYGDVISFTVFEYAVAQNNYNGKNTWTSRNEELVKETEGFDDAFYELTQNGFRLLHLNQLSTTKNDLTLYTKNSYLETHIDEYIDIGDYANITVKFKKYPDTSSTGEQTGVISAEETLSTGEKVQYDYNVIFNVIDDRELSATPNGQKIYLGEDVDLKDYSNFVKDVKLGEQDLNETEYKVALVGALSTDTVGNQTAKIKVSYMSDDRSIEIDVPVKVLWGNTIVAKDTFLEKIVASVSLIDNTGHPKLVANKGDGLTIESRMTRPFLKFYKTNLNKYNKQIFYQTVHQSPSTLMNSWNEEFKTVNENLEYGDVISFSVLRRTPATENYNGVNTWVSRFESLDREAKGYDEAYYELTQSGFSLLHINQLQTKTIDVPIFSSEEYLNEHVTELIDLKGFDNITVKGFSEYPKTTASGQQSSKVVVEEILSNGNTVQYEYEVTINVKSGDLTLEVPDILTFNNFKKSKSDQIIQRENSKNLGLVVYDNRGENTQGNWTLTAKTSTDNSGITPYLVYRNKQGEDSYLNKSAVPIYIQNKQISVSEPLKVDVSSMWENEDGILLKVPSINKLSSKSYSATITWNLVEGPV